jgi:hypothetical protein
MPIGTPEGFLDITNATLRTSVVGISNTGPTGELSVGSNLHVNTTASNVLQVVGNVSSHHMTLGEISLVPAHGLENVTEVGNTTPYTVSFSNATTGLATTSNLHVGGSLKVGVIDFVNPGLTLATVTNNSNVTPYTVDLRNATTGLVTTANVIVGKDLQVAGNATVTGDLNVSGALGILDAIYPVGAVIDRATAITDTHLNGKYKAFLAAPNQEWELVSDGQDVVPLEYLTQLGETTSYCGRATLTPATGGQNLSTSFLPITGTEITNFVPVVGTTKILYKTNIQVAHQDHNGLFNLRIEVKEGTGSWTLIPKTSVSYFNGASYPNDRIKVSTIVYVGDTTTDLSEGRTSTARPTLSFRVVGRDYDSSYDVRVHQSSYHFDGDGSTVATPQFVPPHVDVVSVGTEANLKYKRTL